MAATMQVIFRLWQPKSIGRENATLWPFEVHDKIASGLSTRQNRTGEGRVFTHPSPLDPGVWFVRVREIHRSTPVSGVSAEGRKLPVRFGAGYPGEQTFLNRAIGSAAVTLTGSVIFTKRGQ